MKICYISNNSIPSHVPSSLQIIKTCEYLSKNKNHVTLIIPNTAQSSDTISNFYDTKSKFTIIRMLNYKKFPLGLDYYLFSILSFFKAIKISELIISRNYFVIFLCVFFKKNCVIELHQEISIESRIVNLLYKIFNIFDKKSLVKIICISDAIKRKYIEDFKIRDIKKIEVLPSGTSLKIKFSKSFETNKLKLGYFGSISSSKGVSLILKLAQIDCENNYYIFGGLSSQIMNLKKKYKLKNLYLCSHQNYKQNKKNLSKMDILLIPYTKNVKVAGDVSDISKYTSPLKLFDYMSAGKLILSSKLEVLGEILHDKQDCIFIKNYLNPFSWLLEIKKIKNNLSMRNIIAKNSHIKAQQYLHEKRVIKYLEN